MNEPRVVEERDFDYDVLVIGSGFGGSVTALRLTEKGYRVGVLEAGDRFDEASYPKTSWDVKNFLFLPDAGCYGIQRIDMVRDCMIVAGAGVGGGSLVYANTLYEPLEAFYRDPSWSHICDWKAELAPYYDQAKRMLGVVENPLRTPSDEVMEKVAGEMGVAETFHPTPVGVFFGTGDQAPGETVADPYFGGAGPERQAVHRLRRVHDRLSAPRQEHPAEELPLPRRAGRRRRPPADHRHPGPPSRAVAATRSTPAGRRPSSRAGPPPRRSPPSTWSSPPLRSAPRSCCTGSRPRATCRSSATGSATSPAPTPRRSWAPSPLT